MVLGWLVADSLIRPSTTANPPERSIRGVLRKLVLTTRSSRFPLVQYYLHYGRIAREQALTGACYWQ